jgi:hypothetical protein
MGAWSVEPFGNDGAADFADELDDAQDWMPVESALGAALSGDYLEVDEASCAVAAVEVVARALGRPTQDDSWTESVAEFVARVALPSGGLVSMARDALAAATGPESELTELWVESQPDEWRSAIDRLRAALDA